jgi:hypothetical protein
MRGPASSASPPLPRRFSNRPSTLCLPAPGTRWIPYTDDVVVVGSNPLQPEEDAEKLRKSVKQMSEYNKVAPLRELLKQVRGHTPPYASRTVLNRLLGACPSLQRHTSSHRILQTPWVRSGRRVG